eukprot:GHVP01050344.1.p1 GENE.GHVP01050344.1~~GHVP01050344.1.p1  ORF type:complete len:758 (+),score=123.01 GHVP01050344.1:111-2276(+)
MEMMDRITKILSTEKEHGLLESPTGTGKTLAILAPITQWLEQTGGIISSKKNKKDSEKENQLSSESSEDEKEETTRLFFTTRTHSQIKQVVSEYRRLDAGISMACAAGRKHLCTNVDVKKRINIDDACKAARIKRTCKQFFNISRVVETAERVECWDIEDLASMAKKVNGCAYYASRELVKSSDITFMPYQYILDKRARRGFDIKLDNSIVVFDEAHNIEDSCRDAVSFNIRLKEIINVMSELRKYSNHAIMNNIGSESARESIMEVRGFLKRLFDWSVKNIKDTKESELSFMNEELDEFIKDVDLGREILCAMNDIKKLQSEENEDKDHSNKNKDRLQENSLEWIEYINEGLSNLINQKSRMVGPRSFSIILSKKNDEVNMKVNCLDPAFVFKEISHKCRNLILTSGTLSPMETFSSELDTTFVSRLEADHVIKEGQICPIVIKEGRNGYLFNGIYKNASSYEYQREVTSVIVDVCKNVPFGVLCFFSSYASLNSIYQILKINKELLNIKELLIEDGDMKTTISKHYSIINNAKNDYNNGFFPDKNGSLILAVYRGKISEGLDFKDDYARSVICLGIPFPSIGSHEVQNKKTFNDRWGKSLNLVSGGVWYIAQAYKALNQALGRCIRHSKDWGSIILLDSRHSGSPIQKMKISKWVKEYLIKDHSYMESIDKIKLFTNLNLNLNKDLNRDLNTGQLDDNKEVKNMQLENRQLDNFIKRKR